MRSKTACRPPARQLSKAGQLREMRLEVKRSNEMIARNRRPPAGPPLAQVGSVEMPRCRKFARTPARFRVLANPPTESRHYRPCPPAARIPGSARSQARAGCIRIQCRIDLPHPARSTFPAPGSLSTSRYLLPANLPEGRIRMPGVSMGVTRNTEKKSPPAHFSQTPAPPDTCAKFICNHPNLPIF
jgi:hypothetical protein